MPAVILYYCTFQGVADSVMLPKDAHALRPGTCDFYLTRQKKICGTDQTKDLAIGGLSSTIQFWRLETLEQGFTSRVMLPLKMLQKDLFQTSLLAYGSSLVCGSITTIFIWALTAVASPVAEHRLRTRRLSGHGSRAQPLRGMWDLPGLGHEPVSPASAGGPPTTVPPGKPCMMSFNSFIAHLFAALYNIPLSGCTTKTYF
nr:uncharacterized protein LOC132597794 isoform X1 [Globicephala melas]